MTQDCRPQKDDYLFGAVTLKNASTQIMETPKHDKTRATIKILEQAIRKDSVIGKINEEQYDDTQEWRK